MAIILRKYQVRLVLSAKTTKAEGLKEGLSARSGDLVNSSTTTTEAVLIAVGSD